VVHDHHKLAPAYGLRGIHLNSRHPEPPADWTGALSISCHSLAELAERKRQPFAYLSLSPIFDSISKQGYRAAFTAEELAQAREEGIIDRRVMALGGVTFNRLNLVQQMGFGGAMILGDAWK
jgi:thiamine-phosphate pyrophosphorylase